MDRADATISLPVRKAMLILTDGGSQKEFQYVGSVNEPLGWWRVRVTTSASTGEAC